MKNKDTYISVTLTDDSAIKKLNKEYRGNNSVTDVLSFNIEEETEEGKLYLGEVVVNEEQAKRQAGEYGNTPEEEIAELVAHGVLHLLGVHHKEDQ